jgi:hypothetical protein
MHNTNNLLFAVEVHAWTMRPLGSWHPVAVVGEGVWLNPINSDSERRYGL